MIEHPGKNLNIPDRFLPPVAVGSFFMPHGRTTSSAFHCSRGPGAA